MSATPQLSKVIRLDSVPLHQTYFTSEGYLVDRPILTTTGIFEYRNPDGSVRRELRLPEDVFDPESLKSYKGKPIIITHDAGLVTKDNVDKHQIGTILTDGYRSGENVRAEIVIHNTDAMKDAGLKELSLGYNLDLDETPGVWNGEHYDARQKNVRINHLALVREARAGEQARLNIDGRDPETTLRGGKAMSKTENPKATDTHRTDGALPPDQFAKAIEEYKARRAERLAAKKPAAPAVEPDVKVADSDEPAQAKENPAPAVAAPLTIEDKLKMVRDSLAHRDESGDPADLETAHGVIAQQDGDMSVLFDIIDALMAKRDFDSADEPAQDDPDKQDGDEPAPEGGDEPDNADCGGNEPPANTDGDDDDDDDGDDEGKEEPAEPDNQDGDEPEGEPVKEEPKDEPANTDGDDDNKEPETPKAEEKPTTMNADSVDEIVRQRIKVGLVGRQLNLDSLEDLPLVEAKKAVIRAVRPGINLDGKTNAYIDAAYDLALDFSKNLEKDTDYQKRQMFNKDSAGNEPVKGDSAADARKRMIERQQNNNKEDN